MALSYRKRFWNSRPSERPFTCTPLVLSHVMTTQLAIQAVRTARKVGRGGCECGLGQQGRVRDGGGCTASQCAALVCVDERAQWSPSGASVLLARQRLVNLTRVQAQARSLTL